MSKIENKALRNYIYEGIKNLIDTGELRYGEKINKTDLANRFHVSQTPINDALNRLVGEKYLEQQPRKGYYVREFDSAEFCELFEMRAGLEGIAVRLCCENASEEELEQLIHIFDGFSMPMDQAMLLEYSKVDREFHENIIMFAKNRFISEALDSTGFLAKTYQKGLVRGPEITLHEHRMVVEAIRQRDSERAQQQMVWHLLGSRDVFKQSLMKKHD